MRILVTGGAGYIGSHTAQKLIDAGHDVFVYDNLSTGFSAALPKQSQFIMGDVRDAVLLGRVLKDKKIEAVIHFAAKLVVPESILHPLDYYENNTFGVLGLVKACQQQGVSKIVFSSTAALYGNSNPNQLVKENAVIGPLNPYGFSKLMSEQILRDADQAYGIRSVILRYFNVAGAAADGSNGQRTKDATSLIKVAAEAGAGKRQNISVFGSDYPTSDGTCVRDFIHIEDLADLHVKALEYLNDGNATAVFNCGYGRGFSVLEVLSTMKKVSGRNFEVQMEARRQGDPISVVADSSLARKILHWTPKFDDLETICRSTFEWEKSMGQRDSKI